MGQQESRHGLQGLPGGVAGVRAGAAVDVHIHKARHHSVAARAVHRQVLLLAGQVFAHPQDFPILNLNVPLDQAEVLIQVVCVNQQHLQHPPFSPQAGLQHGVQQDEKGDTGHAQQPRHPQAEAVYRHQHPGVRPAEIDQRQGHKAQRRRKQKTLHRFRKPPVCPDGTLV